jgi:ribonucleoside-diphosphate reductase alpha chain
MSIELSPFSEFEKISKRRKELQALGEVPDWYTTQALIMFERKYSFKGCSVQDTFNRIADTLCKHYTVDVEEARKQFFNLLWKGLLAPSTPVMANTGTGRGLVVSCAGSYTEDSIAGFYDAYKETAILSQEGFGTSSYVGDIRYRGAPISRGGKADGIVPVIDSFIDVTSKVSQGGTRRGQVALYVPVGHGDFWETGGYVLKNPATANIGWMYTDKDIDALKAQDPEAIKRWNRLLYLRCRTGKGYIWKPDTANRHTTDAIKNSGIDIKASNLCVEIALPQDKDHTFTCVLSSLNLLNYDKFEPDTVFWAMAFLDCVVSEFLENAKGKVGMEKAIRFTEKARALGLGTLGYHSLLQSKSIPFESLQAYLLNRKIFDRISKEALAATIKLGELFGVPEWCKGTGRRNATNMAIAPNMTSAILAGGLSQGIEPNVSNCFNQQSAAGELTRMNPALISIMKERGVYTAEVMDELNEVYRGSVQHVDWLTEHEKKVFKTAYEIDQFNIVYQAAARQPDIDQGQSLNFFFTADAKESYIAKVHQEVLLNDKIKGAYYLRSERGVKASTGECVACE